MARRQLEVRGLGLAQRAYLIVEAALTSATRDNPLLRRASTSVAWRIGKTLLVFNGISLAWIFFRASSISQAWFVLTRIATGLLSATATQAVIPTRAYKILVICALLHIAIEPYRYRLARWFSASPLPLRWPRRCCCSWESLTARSAGSATKPSSTSSSKDNADADIRLGDQCYGVWCRTAVSISILNLCQ